MDNLEDNKKSNTNSKKVSRKRTPASKTRANGKSGMQNAVVQPAESMLTTSKPMALGDMPLLPNQFLGTPGPSQAAPSIGHIIKSMLHFKWTFIAIFILTTVPAVLAIWTQVVPKYQAKGEVRVRPIIPRLVFNTEDNGLIPLYNSYVNTQVSIIRSQTVLQRVLDQKEVQETEWYKNPSKSIRQKLHGNQLSAMEKIRDDLSAQPRRSTEIIDVSFIAENSEDAQVIVDAVLDQYLKYTREMSDETKDNLYRQLVDQYKTLENEIIGREKVAAELRRSLGTGNPQELVSSKRVRLDQTQANLNRVKQNIALLEWQVKQGLITTTDDSNDIPIAITEVVNQKQPEYYEDTEWRNLDTNVRTIQHRISNSYLTSKHPDAVQAEKDLAFAKELLQRRETQLDEQWGIQSKNLAGVPIYSADVLGIADSSLSPEHQLDRAKYEEQLLLSELEKQQRDFGELFEIAQLLEKENSALKNKRDLFDAVRQRLDQKNVERNVPGTIEVLMGAFVSSKPYNDRRVVFTVMALCMGLGMAGGIVYLRAIRNQAIYTSKEIPQPIQFPILGNIPVAKLRGMLDDEVSPAMTESIRVVRTALLSRLDGQSCTTLLVTSATPGTGKSTFTMMLGKSLAQAGKKILVIDADLKKMALTQQFEDQPNNPGFVQALRDPSKYKQNIFQVYNLDFMPAGKRSDDDTVPEEIANGAFQIFIDKLRKRYNIILLDGSPILPVADSIILSGQVDGTIFVEREHISNRTNIIRAIDRISSADGHLLGTVFIGSESYMNYGYSYGYSGTS